MEVSWRSGMRSSVSAEVAHKELERIRKKEDLTPEAVVEASRPAKAPLHPAFTWDDKEAGELYRRYEARTLIRSVVVKSTESSEPTRHYVHVTEHGEPGRYESVAVVVQSPSLYASALSELQTKLNGALAAIHQLEEAAKGSGDSDRLMRVGLAVKAMETAAEAVRGLQ